MAAGGMSGTPGPKWMKAAKREPSRCGACGWQVRNGCSPACPRRYYALKSAAAIEDSRIALMIWMDLQRHTPGVKAAAAAYAIALSGRARELGLEHDKAGDFDNLPADWATVRQASNRR